MPVTTFPYMTSPGTLPKILNKICEAAVPESFNNDFLSVKLGFKGGNQKMFISWAKKCKLLNSDSTPTQLYKNFRNPISRGAAMAEAIKNGYAELYIRNENAHEISRPEITKIISEITGSPHDNSTVKSIVGTYFFAKEFAEFDNTRTVEDINEENNGEKIKVENDHTKSVRSVKLGLSYTINLVLPKTDDPAVYNAIFKSLNENLLNE